ncbi:MAG: hypothetical protein QF632_04935 [Candidatus Woesearchaeota archaeon]|nr:hypothetical protein [Candidatus Woesearchaeota archaeon]MDP7457650.1 hypothetical protein [Candidatus Woesearchaeota archaeon]
MVKKFRPAKVLVWNGSQLLEAIGKYFATKEDIPVLHFEKGYFKDTLIADFNGVNSFNSFNGKMEKSIDKERYAQFVAKENSVSSNLFHHPYHPYFLVESLYYLYLYLHPMKNGIKDPITSLKKYITFLDYKFENRKVSQKLPSDFVFLPLQLESDSQVTLHSPHFKDMFSLVQFVYARIPKNLWLVVKTHPAETNFSSYKNIRAFARNKRVLLVEDRPINELIDKSKVVVTINSTVGIESLLFSKPVLVLGNAFYRGKGITFDVDVPEEFSFQLKAALQGSVDHKKIEDFLYQLRFHYLHEGDYRNPSRFNFKSIINMIETK